MTPRGVGSRRASTTFCSPSANAGGSAATERSQYEREHRRDAKEFEFVNSSREPVTPAVGALLAKPALARDLRDQSRLRNPPIK